MLAELEHAMVDVGEVRLHVVTAGPKEGPAVLMLHGFPECWWGWSRQIGPLAEAGYRVVVPDLRGYGTSDKPSATSSYGLEHLVGDVIGLLDALQLDRPTLVCHDWGGAVGWQTMLTHPERFRAFVPMNIPHLGVFAQELRRWRQLKKSWYVLAFQVPGLAERLLLRDNCQGFISAMYGNTVNKPFTPEDLDVYREAWTQPGAAKAMISWYRAFVRSPPPRPPHRTVELPSMLIWGKEDRALGFPMVEPSMSYLTQGRLEVIEGAGHFVQHDAAEQVTDLLLDFLAAHGR